MPFASRIDDLTLREALGEDVAAERVKGMKKRYQQVIDNWHDPSGGAEAGRILEQLYVVAPTDPDLPELWYLWAKDTSRGFMVGIPREVQDTPPGRGPVPKELLASLKKEVGNEKRALKERVTFAVQVVKQDPADKDAVKLLSEHLVYTPEPPRVAPEQPRNPVSPTPQVRAGVVAAFGSAGGMPQLVEWLGHDDERVVLEALAALGRIGPAAKPVAEKVKALLKHTAPKVRYTAAETLYAIDPTDKAVVLVLLELLSVGGPRKALGRAANPPKWFERRGVVDEWDQVPAVQAAAEIVFDLDPEAAVKADVYRVVFPRFGR